MSIHERDAESVFEIDITVQNNTLVVGVNGGNIVGTPGNKILWRTGPDTPPFTLEFFQVPSEPSLEARKDNARINIDVAGLPRWPFAEPQPPGGVVGPTRVFTGTLTGKSRPATSFKYYVTVGNLRLDPIVIVDE
jgi:hypothetical protein